MGSGGNTRYRTSLVRQGQGGVADVGEGVKTLDGGVLVESILVDLWCRSDLNGLLFTASI